MLPSGGQDVTEAVAGALGIPMADAEVAKRQIGIGYAAAPEVERGVEAIRTVTTSLIEAIRNTFVYYASSNPGSAAEVVRPDRWRLAAAGPRASTCRAPAGSR